MEKEEQYKLAEQPFDEKYKSKLPVAYYLLRKTNHNIKGSITAKLVTSTFHNTDCYEVGNIYRPISNIV